MDRVRSLDNTTQIVVPGSVSGILIPNTNQVTMRVIAPIMDGGQEVVVDNTFVQWTNVSDIIILKLFNLYLFI